MRTLFVISVLAIGAVTLYLQQPSTAQCPGGVCPVPQRAFVLQAPKVSTTEFVCENGVCKRVESSGGCGCSCADCTCAPQVSARPRVFRTQRVRLFPRLFGR